MSLGSFLKVAGRTTMAFMKRNGHIVLGVGSVLGLFGSIALAYTTRPKMDEVMEERKQKIKEINADESISDEEKEEKITEVNRESTKKVIKLAGPLAACAVVTAGCMGGTVAIAAHRIDTLTTIAKAGDIACNQLALATEEVVGEEKANEIKTKAIENTMAQNKHEGSGSGGSYVNRNGFIITGFGDVPFYDALCGRTFLCSIEAIEHAANVCNAKMSQKPSKRLRIQYNEFCHEIGLPPVKLGEARYFDEPIIINLSNAIPWGEGSLRVMEFNRQLKVGY